MYQRILIAYDGSAHSQRALDCAKDLAQKYAAQLIVVHAFQPIPKEWGTPFMEQAEVHAMRAAEEVMRQAQSRLGDTTRAIASNGIVR